MSSPPPVLPDYEYHLPVECIAQHPPNERDGARMLVLGRAGWRGDRALTDLPDFLSAGDLLVVNDSRVMAARCHLTRASGGRVEVLFLGPGPGPVEALVKPSRRLREGEVLLAGDSGPIRVTLRRSLGGGRWRVEAQPSVLAVMDTIGHVPLPPYIRRSDQAADKARYQTVYARDTGSAAAPTAGLHLSRRLLEALRASGVGVAAVTLHVGLGTFRPLRSEDLERGELHAEWFSVSEGTAAAVREARRRGGRVVAVGTTSARALESATPPQAEAPEPTSGWTRLFIREGYEFRALDGLLTNFHLPGSSLLMLVAALVGRERLLGAYQRAVDDGYRFYSYGDAMLVI